MHLDGQYLQSSFNVETNLVINSEIQLYNYTDIFIQSRFWNSCACIVNLSAFLFRSIVARLLVFFHFNHAWSIKFSTKVFFLSMNSPKHFLTMQVFSELSFASICHELRSFPRIFVHTRSTVQNAFITKFSASHRKPLHYGPTNYNDLCQTARNITWHSQLLIRITSEILIIPWGYLFYIMIMSNAEDPLQK